MIALAYLAYVFLARQTANERYAEREKAAAQPAEDANARLMKQYSGSAVKILQFYVRDPAVFENQGTVICYGVENAKSLRIDPPLPDIYPALNRCVDVTPKHDTKYVLTAEGNDGKTVTAEATVAVKGGAARAEAGGGPKITRFEVRKQYVEQGKHYFTLAFAFENARTVMIDPPVFKPLEDSAPFGEWVVTPDRTTTYTLTVVDKAGHKASKELTVEVPKS